MQIEEETQTKANLTLIESDGEKNNEKKRRDVPAHTTVGRCRTGKTPEAPSRRRTTTIARERTELPLGTATPMRGE